MGIPPWPPFEITEILDSIRNSKTGKQYTIKTV
jgi:hypothetical protein